MDCKYIKKVIDESNILNLSAEEFMKLKEHIEICTQCESTYKEHNDRHILLKEYYENISVNIQEKQKALVTIEKYIHKKRLFYPIPAIALAIFILLISFGIFKYIQYESTRKEQVDFLTNLVYIHNDKNLNWVNLEYNNPSFKKLKKCKYCKYSDNIKVLKFKIRNSYASIFILDKQKFVQLSNVFKYYESNNKYIYVCNMHSNLIHIWISDVPIQEIASFVVSKCSQNIKNSIRIKSKKLGCPCCLSHFIRSIKKYKGCITDINYKTSEVVLKVKEIEKAKEIEKIF